MLDLEKLDEITRLDVMVILKTDTTFVARVNLSGIVIETLQRPNLALVDDNTIAHQPRPDIATGNTLGNPAAGDLAKFADIEHVQHFSGTNSVFHHFRIQHAA